MKRPSYAMASLVTAALAILLTLALSACAASPTPSPTAAKALPSPTSPAPTKAGGTPAAVAPASAKSSATTAAQAPQYGGTLRLSLSADLGRLDDAWVGGVASRTWIQAQELTGGDWTKGPAGGYGANETDWSTTGSDVLDHKTGRIAESWKVDVDSQKGEATVTFKIRSGVRYALNPKSDVSKMVGGRELTVDDVISSLEQATTDDRNWVYRGNPEMRNLDISKTGPMEVMVRVPLKDLVTALNRLSNVRIYPKEIRDQKLDMTKWTDQVGTGAFMWDNYVSGSAIRMVKNPNYWFKDPIGPGKGNQLPYVDAIEYAIIPDPATRLAAYRTAKIDQIDGLTWEDAEQIKKEFPQMPSGEGNYYNRSPMYIRTDQAPFSDVRVRRAMMMATDFDTIKRDINGGRGVIITWPFEYYKEYKDLYVGVDDPDLPASIKEQFTYNPDKAKKLLAEAGYPNGFKTSILIVASEVSYYEMIAGMWSKVGVELALNIKDSATRQNLINTLAFDHLTTGGQPPASVYYLGSTLSGVPGFQNPGVIKDPVIDEALGKIRTLAGTEPKTAFKEARKMALHVLDQAYGIQRPSYRMVNFWWPWIKNYHGEVSVGYFDAHNWAQYIWIDEALKQSMGR